MRTMHAKDSTGAQSQYKLEIVEPHALCLASKLATYTRANCWLLLSRRRDTLEKIEPFN